MATDDVPKLSQVLDPADSQMPATPLEPSESLDGSPALSHILEAIQKSRRILDLQDDWDEEGSPGYAASTWERATGFLADNAIRLWRDKGVYVDAPRVLPGPEGSIDLHWRSHDRQLLINVPPDVDEPATYYGQKSVDQVVKGNLDTSAQNEWLLMWIAT